MDKYECFDQNDTHLYIIIEADDLQLILINQQIQSVGSKYCLDTLWRKANRQMGIHWCHGNGYSQGFAYQNNGQIVFHYEMCLSLAEEENITEQITDANQLTDHNILLPGVNTTNHVVLLKCNSENGTKWDYDEKVSSFHIMIYS